MLPNMLLRFRSASTPLAHWPLASVAVAAPLLGCGPGSVEQGFRVTALDFDGELTLTLTFSQPLANADAIDPNDFRISLARTISYTYTDPETGQTSTDAYAMYTDIGAWGDYYQDRFSFASASLGASDNQLVLTANSESIGPTCMLVALNEMYYEQYEAQYPNFKHDIAIFVHYAAGDIPLESEDGKTLVDIGRDWVLTQENYLTHPGFGFNRLSPKLRIPCP